MKWFYDLKIRMKLLVSFVLVAIIAGAVGVIGITNIRKIDDRDTMLYEKMTVPVSQMAEIQARFHMHRVNIRDAVLAQNSDDAKAFADMAMEQSDAIGKVADEFEKLIISKEMRAAWDEFAATRKAYAPQRDKMLEYALAGRNKDAMAVMYGEAKRAADAEQAAIEKIVGMKLANAKETSDDNSKMANAAVRSMMLLILVAVVAAVGLGMFIAKVIGVPLKDLSGTADKLALGDVDVTVEAKSRDEIGDLMRSMSAMVTNIRAQADAAEKIAAGDLDVQIQQASDKDVLARSMTAVVTALRDLVAEAGMLSKAAVDGKLDTRGDVSKFEGGYRDIVQGVNDTLDAVIGPLNVAAEYVERISNGDIPNVITDEYHGDFNEIKNNLNRCINTLNSLIAEMNRMSDEHNKGDIDIVIPVDEFDGVYRTMAQGVNDMVNGHIAVKKKAMACVAEFGKGNFDAELEKFPGKKAFINDTIEGVRSNLKQFHQELSTLVDASKEGRLSTRGDSDQFAGDWAKLVVGVNDILDAVIKPVNEAAEVLEKLAQNDLTSRVVGDYQGDHAKIKASLNSACEALEAIIIQAAEASNSVTDTAKEVASTAQEVGKASQSVAETINQVAAGSQEQTKMVTSASASMEQLSQAIEEVSKGAQSQAKTVEETVSLVQQITEAIDTVAKTAQSAASASMEVAEVAKSGGDSVGKSVEGMARIKETSANVAAAVVQLGENSKQIGAIVETIDDIAEQTNLLALNAAIEAARAGEHGKGFAVVADEVRKLAERSSMATKEIADLIGSIQQMTEHAVEAMQAGTSEVEEGTELANQAGEALGNILDAVNSIVRQIEDVSASTQEMSASSAEVARAVESLSAVTEQSTAATEQMAASATEVTKSVEQVAAVSEENAAAAEEVSAAAEEQNASVEEMSASAGEVAKIADDLQTVVARFKVDKSRAAGRSIRVETSGSDSMKRAA